MAQDFGSGGSPSADCQGTGAQKFALTTSVAAVHGDNRNPVDLRQNARHHGQHQSSTQLFFWFDAGSDFNARTDTLGQQSGTFDIAMVQIEEGSDDTVFEQRPIGFELALCQRYYETGRSNLYLHSTSGNGFGTHASFRVTKRAAPTVVQSAVSSSNVSSRAVDNSGVDGYRHTVTPSGAATVVDTIDWTADTEF